MDASEPRSDATDADVARAPQDAPSRVALADALVGEGAAGAPAGSGTAEWPVSGQVQPTPHASTTSPPAARDDVSDYTEYVCWDDHAGVVRVSDETQVMQLVNTGGSKKLRRMMGKALVQEWNNQVRGMRSAKGIT